MSREIILSKRFCFPSVKWSSLKRKNLLPLGANSFLLEDTPFRRGLFFVFFIIIVLGLTTRQPLWIILCRLLQKGRRELVEEMKERQGRKRSMNESEETEEMKTFPRYLTCCKDSRPCPIVSQSQLDAPVTHDTRHLCLTQSAPEGDWCKETQVIKVVPLVTNGRITTKRIQSL